MTKVWPGSSRRRTRSSSQSLKRRLGSTGNHRFEKLKQEEGSYIYTPPSGGKSVGLLPFRPSSWKKAQQNVEQELDGSAATSVGVADCHMTDLDLAGDTYSGDDAN